MPVEEAIPKSVFEVVPEVSVLPRTEAVVEEAQTEVQVLTEGGNLAAAAVP